MRSTTQRMARGWAFSAASVSALACTYTVNLGRGDSLTATDTADAGIASSSSPKAPLGQRCTTDSDCASPLVCAQGRCHATCSPDVGCYVGHHQLLPCLTEFAAVPVCPLPCDEGWGADSSLCTRAGEPDDGPPGLYDCSSLPRQGAECASDGSTCSMSCTNGVSTLRQDCDRGVCNCTYDGVLSCRCVTADPPIDCSFCCDS